MAKEEPSRLKQALLEDPEEEISLSIDDIISKYVGEFGFSQLAHFILSNLTMVFAAMSILVITFAHHEPHWRCKDQTDEQCLASSSVCETSIDPSSWEWIPGKEASVVSEWNLVCDQAYKAGLAGSMFFIGGILGSGLLGSLTDKFLGRKGGVAVSCFILATMGSLTALAPNYWVYLLLRGLTGIGYGGIMLSSFVLSTEVIGPSKRGVVGLCAFFFFTLGILCLVGLAYLSSASWRQLYAVISLPSIIYSLAILPFLPESPRWYAVRGNVQKSLEVLKLFARRNGNSIPSNITISLDGLEGNQGSRGSLIDVFQHPELRKRMLIIMLTWFSVLIMFYGISFNAVNVDLNLFVTVIINGLSETPGYVVSALLLEKVGRRYLLFASLIVSGGSCLLGSLITFALPQGYRLVRVGQVVCGALGLFGVSSTYNLMFSYAVELFPTEVRNSALGTGSISGQVGAVVAPLVVISSTFHPGIPFAVIGSFGILASLACLLLPETLNQGTLETIQGMTSTSSKQDT